MLSQEELGKIQKSAGSFEIKNTLGSSALGIVYHIEHSEYGACVLKCFKSKISQNRSFLKLFEKGVQKAQDIEHPNFAAIYKASTQFTPYLLREMVVGDSLKSRLKESGAIPSLEATRYLIKTTIAMQAAYNFDLLHNNLKPANVIITPENGIKVVDFSLPASLPYYFSPEHCKGSNLDSRSDIYCLGIIYYNALTGQAPFKGKTFNELKDLHLQSPYPPIADLPDAIKKILDKTLAKDPKERYSNFLKLLRDLRKAAKALKAQAKGNVDIESVTFSLTDPMIWEEDKGQQVVEETSEVVIEKEPDSPEVEPIIIKREEDEETISTMEDLAKVTVQELGEDVLEETVLDDALSAMVKKCLFLATGSHRLLRGGQALKRLIFSLEEKHLEKVVEYLREVLRRECWLLKEVEAGKLTVSIDLEEAKTLRYYYHFDDIINEGLNKLPKLATIQKTIITRVQDVEDEVQIMDEEGSGSHASSVYSVVDTIISIQGELPELQEMEDEDSVNEDWSSGDVGEDEDWLGVDDKGDLEELSEKVAEQTIEEEDKTIDVKVNFQNPYQTRAWLRFVRENNLKQGKHFSIKKPGRIIVFEINLPDLQDYQRKQEGISSVKEFFQGDYEISRLDHGGMATVLKLTTKNDITLIFLRPENIWARERFAPYLKVRKGGDGKEVIYAEMPKGFELVVKVAFEGREEALIYEARLLAELAQESEVSKYIIGMVQQGSFLASTDKDEERVGYYLMLEYATLGNVDQFSKNFPEKRLPPAVAYFVLYNMILALQHLEAKGIIHRDIKPQNILLDSNFMPKLTDFGLAITVSQEGGKLNEERRRLLRLVDKEFLQITTEKEQCETRLKRLREKLKHSDDIDPKQFEEVSQQITELKEQISKLVQQESARADGLKSRYRPMSAEEIALKGEFAGSLLYAAPEQFSTSKRLSCACDVYQMAAVAYTLLTGKPPVQGKNIATVMNQIILSKKPQVSDIIKNSLVVDALSDLIFGMMKNNVQERTDNNEVRKRLEEILLKHFEELKVLPKYSLEENMSVTKRVKWEESVDFSHKVHRVCVQYLEEIYKKIKAIEEKKAQKDAEIVENIFLWWDQDDPPAHFRFRCPRCNKKLKIPMSQVGKVMRCPNCQGRLMAKRYEE